MVENWFPKGTAGGVPAGVAMLCEASLPQSESDFSYPQGGATP